MLSNEDYILHVIRDVFGRKISPILYGRDIELLNAFYSNTHSMGATLLYSDAPLIGDRDNVYLLNIDEPVMPDYSHLFDSMFSFNYKYSLEPPHCDRVAKHFNFLLREKAQIFLVNPGTWSYCFDDYFERCIDKEREVKRFSMFSNEKVFVYENI